MVNGHRYQGYTLYDLRIIFEYSNSEYEDFLDEVIKLFPLTRVVTDTQTPHLCIRISSIDSAPRLDSKSKQMEAYGLNLFQSADSISVFDGSSIFVSQPLEGRGHIYFHPQFTNKTLMARSNFFLIGLFSLLMEKAYFDLHAAGVMWNNVGYLLVGESGSGKSTATVNLVNQGWNFLSDDSLLLHENQNGIAAYSFRQKFLVDPRQWIDHTRLAKYLEIPNTFGFTKNIIDMPNIFPDQFKQSVVPEIMIFTRLVSEDESRLVPLQNTDALLKLMQQSFALLLRHSAAKQQLMLLTKLIKQTRSYELLAGRDIRDNPEKLTKLLLNSTRNEPNNSSIYNNEVVSESA